MLGCDRIDIGIEWNGDQNQMRLYKVEMIVIFFPHILCTTKNVILWGVGASRDDAPKICDVRGRENVVI